MNKWPRAEVLGVRLGMEEEEAHERLEKVGRREEEGEEREAEQEVWILGRESRFAYLLVRFNREERVSLVTAVVREGRRMMYSEVASLKNARRTTDGRNYTYTWRVPPRGGQAGYVVVARGSHPDYLTSYSIFRTIQ
jgi:hypothetical protein